jgi:hypothetical protein
MANKALMLGNHTDDEKVDRLLRVGVEVGGNLLIWLSYVKFICRVKLIILDLARTNVDENFHADTRSLLVCT